MFPAWFEDWFDVSEDEGWRCLPAEEPGPYGRVVSGEVVWTDKSRTVERAVMSFRLKEAGAACIWKPLLCPLDDMVIGDAVFRSPAIVFRNGARLLAFIPDVGHCSRHRRIAPQAMDYVEPERLLWYGLQPYEKTGHVYQRQVRRPFEVRERETLFRFYALEWESAGGERDFRPLAGWMWEKYGQPHWASAAAGRSPLEQLRPQEAYVRRTYVWAFELWPDSMWAEFELAGRPVGGCNRQVRAFHSPGNPDEPEQPLVRAIWNQAWFSSLRSAYGFMEWGRRFADPELTRRGRLTKALALAAPQRDGLFPAVYRAGEDGDWTNGEWGHSDRCPPGHSAYGHLLDMSWTCFWMLKWYEDWEADPELLDYARAYADRLLRLQSEDGGFPAYIRLDTGHRSPYLADSPEMAMHAWFLVRLYRLTGEKAYLQSAVRTMDNIRREIVPEGRWEDFETYWSCSKNQPGKQYGVKDLRSGLYNQCNFSIYWTTEAWKELYEATGEPAYLTEGERLLAELSLYQAVWQPPYMGIPVFGGFGVMTSDDEWNDARQCLFALTYYGYYRLTGRDEYLQRCLAAAGASFQMMYCPENPYVKQLYEQRFPYFSERDYGFTMENAYHGAVSETVGNFTIFDWGNGTAAASLGMLWSALEKQAQDDGNRKNAKGAV